MQSPQPKVSFRAATVAAALGAGVTVAAGQTYGIKPYSAGGIAMASPQNRPMAEASTSPNVSEALLNAKLETAEARTDTKFERLIGKIDGLATAVGGVSASVGELKAKVDSVERKAGNAKAVIITTIIATALAFAALSFAGVQIFQGGMSATATAFQSGATRK